MLLQHYSDGYRVLRYDPQTGLSQEVAGLAKEHPTGFGFFADSKCGVWGVYASPEGPILFHGTRRYRLNEPSTILKLVRGNDESHFGIHQGGVLRAECWYTRASPSDWGYDNWSAEEESADFFMWIKNRASSSDFLAHYTRPVDEEEGQ